MLQTVFPFWSHIDVELIPSSVDREQICSYASDWVNELKSIEFSQDDSSSKIAANPKISTQFISTNCLNGVQLEVVIGSQSIDEFDGFDGFDG